MTYQEEEGGRTGEDGAPAGEGLGMGRFDEGQSARLVSSKAPSFKPNELDAYDGCHFDLIGLHAAKAVDKEGRPLGKTPTKGWRDAEPMAIDAAKAHMASGCNVGVRLRRCDLVVDVDPRNFDGDDDPLARLGKDLNVDWCDFPIVITGSGGRHIYMRKPDDVELVNTLPSYAGVEFKSFGRQVVAAGSAHPETGQPYRWDDDFLAVPLRSRPDAPAGLIDLANRPKRSAGAVAGEYTPDQLATMLTGLDASSYAGHDRWLELMMACHDATAGDGREEFISWSIGDPAYSGHADVIGRRWDSLSADRNGRRITARTLLKAVVDAGREDLIPRDSAEDDFPNQLPDIARTTAQRALDEVNERHFTVLTAGKYLVGREGICPFFGHTTVEWFPDTAVQKHLDSRTVTLPDGAKKPLGSWWIKNAGRRQYDGVLFDPTPDADHIGLYNLWRGWAVEPKPGNWSLMKRLVRDVLCRGDEASFDYALKWAAHMVQHPNTPAEVALVFKGAKGVGKGTFARALKELAGQHGRQVAQAEHFTGKFNEHLADTILLFVDEGLWAGDKKLEGALKNLITEPVLTFEGKHKPVVSGPNRLHIVIASNEDWVIPASQDERRFAVFEADAEARASLPADFFADLRREMSDGGLAAMLFDLQQLDLGEWHPRSHIPVTRALTDQKVQSFRGDPMAFWWFRQLEDGRVDALSLLRYDWPCFDVDSDWKEVIVESVNAQARYMGKRPEFTKTAVARFLSKVGVDVKARDRRGGKVWRVPALADARRAFEDYVGGQIDWDAAD